MFGFSSTVVYIVMAVFLSLVPSILIFAIFPKTQVQASGPLQGLTIRSSGAFAAYLIVFLLIIAYGGPHPVVVEDKVWEVRANIIVKDGDGKIVDQGLIDPNSLSVSIDPKTERTTLGKSSVRVRTKVAENNGKMPDITFTYGDLASYNLDLQSNEDKLKIERDWRNGIIFVKTPIELSPPKVAFPSLAPASR